MCSQRSRFDVSHLSCNPSTTLYMTCRMAPICWSGPIFRILKLWELEVSQLGFKSWRDFLEANLNGTCDRISRHGVDLIIPSDGCRALLVNHTLGWHYRQFIASGYLFASISPMLSTRYWILHRRLNGTLRWVHSNMNQSCTYSHNISRFSHPTVCCGSYISIPTIFLWALVQACTSLYKL